VVGATVAMDRTEDRMVATKAHMETMITTARAVTITTADMAVDTETRAAMIQVRISLTFKHFESTFTNYLSFCLLFSAGYNNYGGSGGGYGNYGKYNNYQSRNQNQH
jgi:hypothetical protein